MFIPKKRQGAEVKQQYQEPWKRDLNPSQHNASLQVRGLYTEGLASQQSLEASEPGRTEKPSGRRTLKEWKL